MTHLAGVLAVLAWVRVALAAGTVGGTYAVEHSATLVGQFSEAEIVVPVPLNWPSQTVWDFTAEPEGVQVVLDESRTVGLAVLRVPGPAASATVTLRYKVQLGEDTVDMAGLETQQWPAYDTSDPAWRDFTGPQTHVECDDPAIAALGQRLAQEQPDPLRRARAAFDWVVDNLSYADQPASGARATFYRRTGCCADYAMLFAAICRAAGVPARDCSGFLADGNGRWHAWAEFLLPGGRWVPCDPQTADTVPELRARYFGSLGGAQAVLLCNRHDLRFTLNGVTRTLPTLQSGHFSCQGEAQISYELTSRLLPCARYGAILYATGAQSMVRCELGPEQLSTLNEEVRGQGWRCISVGVAPGAAGPVYAAIWEPNPEGMAWQLLMRETPDSMRAAVARVGLQPRCVAMCDLDGQTVVAGVLTAEAGLDRAAVVGASQAVFSQRLSDMVGVGYVPISLAAAKEGQGTTFSAVFQRLQTAGAVRVRYNRTAEELETDLTAFRQEGFIPVALSATAGYPTHYHYSAINTGHPVQWMVLRDLQAGEFQRALEEAAALGFQAVSIAAY